MILVVALVLYRISPALWMLWLVCIPQKQVGFLGEKQWTKVRKILTVIQSFTCSMAYLEHGHSRYALGFICF